MEITLFKGDTRSIVNDIAAETSVIMGEASRDVASLTGQTDSLGALVADLKE